MSESGSSVARHALHRPAPTPAATAAQRAHASPAGNDGARAASSAVVHRVTPAPAVRATARSAPAGAGAAVAASGSAASGRERSRDARPRCWHGPLILHVCRTTKNVGRSYLTCPLPRGHQQRCDDAFVWLDEVAAESNDSVGEQLPAPGAAVQHGQASRGELRAAGGARTLVVAQRQGVVARTADRTPVARPSMRERLVVVNQRANARQPVQQAAYEAAQVMSSLQRMRAAQNSLEAAGHCV